MTLTIHTYLRCASMQAGDQAAQDQVEVTKLTVPGAPVFSLAKMPTVLPDGTVYKQPRTKPPGIFLGTSNKQVLTWMLDAGQDVSDKVGWTPSRTTRACNLLPACDLENGTLLRLIHSLHCVSFRQRGCSSLCSLLLLPRAAAAVAVAPLLYLGVARTCCLAVWMCCPRLHTRAHKARRRRRWLLLQVVLDGHTGWVRALAVTDKWLFT